MKQPRQKVPMTQAPMKKTAAIRLARSAVLPPFSVYPPAFTLRVPSDLGRLDSERIDVLANDYLDAQHLRSYCVARIALALMGLGDVPLTRQDGDTLDQLMDKAINRAERGIEKGATPFWHVRLAPASAAQHADEPELALRTTSAPSVRA